MAEAVSHRIKWSTREATLSPSLSAEFKNAWNYTNSSMFKQMHY